MDAEVVALAEKGEGEATRSRHSPSAARTCQLPAVAHVEGMHTETE